MRARCDMWPAVEWTANYRALGRVEAAEAAVALRDCDGAAKPRAFKAKRAALQPDSPGVAPNARSPMALLDFCNSWGSKSESSSRRTAYDRFHDCSFWKCSLFVSFMEAPRLNIETKRHRASSLNQAA